MSIFLVVNTFVWYFFAFNILRNLINSANLSYYETSMIWTVNFGAAAVSALSSTKIADRVKHRVHFIYIWLFIGFLSSLAPIFMNAMTTNLLLISFLYGISFGLGTPVCMEYFIKDTIVENRGRFGGISFFTIAIGVFLLSIIAMDSSLVQILISAAWRGSGLLALFFVKTFEKVPLEKENVPSYISILKRREFLFYIVPWCMFCLVNYTSISIMKGFFGEDFVRFSSVVESVLLSVFAVVAGYLADVVGRKRLAIAGFAMLGLGYAALGIYPMAVSSWYFYTVVDGVAWGIFSPIFLIILWGDLAHDEPSGNFYALGGLPFLLSNFLQIIVGPYIAESVSVYTIFSLASFFLFLAVFPLMYAPETLPEKRIRERELKIYIEKAKKVKEKYA
jgi:MFS family permease